MTSHPVPTLSFQPAKPNGFSLVELSLVLVVVGLLAGGVMAGKSISRSAEIRSTIGQLGKYNSAVNSFQTEFKSLPGDMPNATDYWNAAMNGNGDGQISGAEIYGAWQDLSNAKMIEGAFSGISAATNTNASLPGTNVPAGRVKDSGFDFWYIGNQLSSSTTFFPANYGNAISFGTSASQTDISRYPALKAEAAFNIDTKLDDGLPIAGIIMAMKNASAFTPNCVSAAGTYNMALTGNTAACSLILITGY